LAAYKALEARLLASGKNRSSWSWSPETLAKIPALFRASTRIELRCTKSISSLDTRQLLDAPLQAWMREKGLKPFDPGSRPYAAWIDEARTELLARRRASGAESLEQLPVLFAISDNPMASGPEMIDAATTVQRLVMANAAPPAVKAAVLLTAGSFMVQSKLTYAQVSKGKLALLNSALADTTLANDRQAGPALLLVKADVARRTKDVVSARDALDGIVAFPGLADNDPVKVGALIRIASMNAAAGNVDAARAAFEKTGLTESQCALVDAKPVMTGGSMSDADFPREAMQWGFSGFAVTEFDIDSLGKPVGIRTTIAYPPLIFGPATNKGAARFRYQQSFRPNGGLGCTGQSQRVAYHIPK
jgi:hypothetical protein